MTRNMQRNTRRIRTALLAMLVVASSSAHAELILSAEHSWGVTGPLAEDEWVEYLLCDEAGHCQLWITRRCHTLAPHIRNQV